MTINNGPNSRAFSLQGRRISVDLTKIIINASELQIISASDILQAMTQFGVTE